MADAAVEHQQPLDQHDASPQATAPAAPASAMAGEAEGVAKLAELLHDLTSDAARRYVTPASLLRHLRARDGNVAAAETAVRATVAWREAERVDSVTADDVARVAALNAMYVAQGRDKEGNKVIVMRAGAYNPFSPEERLRYVTHVMETVFPPGQDDADAKATWIIDFTLFGKKRSPDGRAVMKRTQAVLQDHYPERLARAYVFDLPWFFNWIYNIAWYFMSEKTRSKIIVVNGSIDSKKEKFVQHIDLSQLEQRFGGEVPDLAYSEPEHPAVENATS